MSIFELKVISWDKTLFAGRVKSLSVDAIDGKLQVLANHISYINALKPSDIKFEAENGEKKHQILANGGVLKVKNNKAVVLMG